MLTFGLKEGIFEITLSNGENYLFDTHRNFYVKAIEDAVDEDYKTASVHGVYHIPKGTEVRVVGRLDNFYGQWLQVLHKGHQYSVDPRSFEYVGVKEDNPENLITLCHDCHMKRHYGEKGEGNDKNN